MWVMPCYILKRFRLVALKGVMMDVTYMKKLHVYEWRWRTLAGSLDITPQ